MLPFAWSLPAQSQSSSRVTIDAVDQVTGSLHVSEHGVDRRPGEVDEKWDKQYGVLNRLSRKVWEGVPSSPLAFEIRAVLHLPQPPRQGEPVVIVTAEVHSASMDVGRRAGGCVSAHPPARQSAGTRSRCLAVCCA